MKTSIAIALFILAVAGIVGWRDHQEFASLRKEHSALFAEAAKLGIVTLDSGQHDGGLRITRHDRTDKDSQAHQAARDLIAFAKELQGYKESGESMDQEAKSRMLGLIMQMQSLNAGQLKILIAEFRNASGLDDETRRNLISFTITTLANNHPETALKLLSESGDLLTEKSTRRHVLSSALTKWAERDPSAALEWVRANKDANPGLANDDVKASLVKGAASNDLKMAFSLIGELGFENPNRALQDIAKSVSSPADRTQFMQLMVEFEKEGKSRISSSTMMGYLAEGIAKDGFDSGSHWIEENSLSPENIGTIADVVGRLAKNGEQGRWIGWMGEHLPAGRRENQIASSMQSWTNKDYRAAGEWLAAAPEGPTKTASVKGYVDAIAQYDPQTATQWALTLPNGKDRSSALETVYRKMPRNTQAETQACEAFKTQHGIE